MEDSSIPNEEEKTEGGIDDNTNSSSNMTELNNMTEEVNMTGEVNATEETGQN